MGAAMLGGLLAPAGSAAASEAERPEAVSHTPADEAGKGKAFWEDDRLPEASAEQKASRAAAEAGRRVEVAGLTTETGQVFANPDGTFTAESSASIERVRRGTGWAAVDTTLVRADDGTLAPKAALDMTLSGGGDKAPLVRFERGGHSYEVHSPWTLPEPVLDGSHAVYTSVRPDVDLVVQVLPDGFTQNLVVHTPQAAAALKSIRYPVRADGLTVRNHDGAVSLVDDGGHPAFINSAPLMWDAGTPGSDAGTAAGARSAAGTRSALAAEAGPVDPVDAVSPPADARTAIAGMAAGQDELTVVPDQEFLADPKTTYPVVIDPPTVAGKLTGWTALWSNESSSTFWNTSHALGVGYDAYVDNKKARSLFQFDTRSVAGKKILHADFSAYEIWSANCEKRNIELWRTGSISSSTKWSSSLSWSSKVDTVSAAKGHSSSCPDGTVEFDATAAVAYTAKAKSTTTTLGLRASESDPIAWKQFMSPKDADSTTGRKPVLSITYVSPPTAKPSSVKMSDPNVSCSASSSPAIIRDTTPRLTATPTSSDGSKAVLRPNFELYAGSSTSPTSLKPSTWTASGTAGTMPTATLAENTTYHFRARTEYKYTYGGTTGYLYGPWSSSCYFKVDSKGPPKPTVTSVNNQYPECAGTSCASSPETGSVGMTGRFTIGAGATDVRRFVTHLNGVKVEDKTYTADTASHTVTITPDKRLTNTLRVQTFDAAGNPGETRDYLFNVARAAAPVGVWKFDEGTGTAAANTQGTAHHLTVTGGSWTDKARLGKGFRSTAGDGYAAAAGPIVDTTGNFAVSSWVKLNSKTQSTVMQQRGTKTGGFQLYYSTAYDRWIFNRYDKDATDDGGATIVRAIGTKPPVLGAWTHLLGVYDRQAQKIRLYVNGTLNAETAFTTPWAANGPFEIGRWGTSNQLDAEVDQAAVFNRVVYPDELPGLTNLENPDTGHPQAELLAHWALDESAGTTGLDSSGRGNTLSLQSGSTFTTTDDYAHGNVLSLDADVLGRATAPVKLDASGSFTVAGWVNLESQSKLEDTTVAHSPTVFSHPGANRNAFRLWYRQEAGESVGDWNFGVYATDVLEGPAATTVSDEVNPPGGWIHVAGVFDSANRSAKLYVTGERQGDEEGVLVDDVFQSSGPLMIGGARRHDTGAWGNALPGQLDDMRVYAGVLSEAEITQLSIADEPPVDIG
ncbi:LamG domain-containing protein [Streptomyces sp. V2I9]|uniref:LamG domain-containing protein n=1 Tax=Streptomyces sp. V2I9 TaxID=3042304 RepID=UPI0027D7D379|nr:LamG domain-containing protein [Streptomyces sp. V2I9]